MVISLGYGELVMPTKDAVTVLEILERAEKYRTKYNGKESTQHVYPNTDTYSARLITEDLYRIAKLAGEPDE
jgi:citrate synthase